MKGSYHMEKEGLVRSVGFLQKHKLDIGVLVTDRHIQIAKWVRENLPQIIAMLGILQRASDMCAYVCMHVTIEV